MKKKKRQTIVLKPSHNNNEKLVNSIKDVDELYLLREDQEGVVCPFCGSVLSNTRGFITIYGPNDKGFATKMLSRLHHCSQCTRMYIGRRDAKSTFGMLDDSLKCKDNYIILADGKKLYANGSVKKQRNFGVNYDHSTSVIDPHLESAQILFSNDQFKENAEIASRNIGRKKKGKGNKSIQKNKSQKSRKRPFFDDVIYEIVEENSTLIFKKRIKKQKRRTTPKRNGRLYVKIIYSGTMSHK